MKHAGTILLSHLVIQSHFRPSALMPALADSAHVISMIIRQVTHAASSHGQLHTHTISTGPLRISQRCTVPVSR